MKFRNIGLGVLLILVTLSSPAGSAQFTSVTGMTYSISSGGGHASISSHHVVQVVSYSPLTDIGEHPALLAKMFRNGGVVREELVVDPETFANSTGLLFTSLHEQGACYLVEGLYSARTDAGTYVFPFFFAGGGTSVSGLVFINCPILVPPLPPCESAITMTLTSLLPLDSSRVNNSPLQLNYPLSRVQKGVGEEYIVDEWAILDRGAVLRSSSQGFGSIALGSLTDVSGGTFLVIEEPVHVANSRRIPKPSLQLLTSQLPPFRQGISATVTARVEFSRDNLVDHVEILHTSEPVDENWLRTLFERRLALQFASDRRHRAIAYFVADLEGDLQIQQSIVVLPQCCSGGGGELRDGLPNP